MKEEDEEKKKNRAANPEKKGKKKVKSGQKVRLILFVGPSCVFNYKNVIELWVMEIENSQNVFSVFITHSGGATLWSGCSQEHPDLKFFFLYIIIKFFLFVYP